jgi:hypothetical protein
MIEDISRKKNPSERILYVTCQFHIYRATTFDGYGTKKVYDGYYSLGLFKKSVSRFPHTPN